jgi:hypothetical protein
LVCNVFGAVEEYFAGPAAPEFMPYSVPMPPPYRWKVELRPGTAGGAGRGLKPSAGGNTLGIGGSGGSPAGGI